MNQHSKQSSKKKEVWFRKDLPSVLENTAHTPPTSIDKDLEKQIVEAIWHTPHLLGLEEQQQSIKNVKQLIISAVISELKAYKMNFATDLSVEAYEALENRIATLKAELGGGHE